MSKHHATAAVAVVLLAPAALPAGPMDTFSGFWARRKGALTTAVDQAVRHAGRPTVRMEHTGSADWCATLDARPDVRAGEIIELTAVLRCRPGTHVSVSAVTRAPGGKVVEWVYAPAAAPADGKWHEVRCRFVVPPGVGSIEPRLTGAGPGLVWAAGFTWKRAGDLAALADPDLPESLTAETDRLAVTLHTADATLTVRDRATGRTWRQRPAAAVKVLSARREGSALAVKLVHGPGAAELSVTVQPEPNAPEVLVRLAGRGPMARALGWPGPFVTPKGTYLVVPMNEGISYPVDDASIRPMRLIAYGGHGICMAFFGATDGSAGYMGILETADDAAVAIRRVGGLLCIAPQWEPQRGRFGYARRVRYVFFREGGHVAMCKRYRAYVRARGTLKTLAEKRKEVPAVDLLLGAVNVWCWDRDPLGMVREMQAAGIGRILWSRRGDPRTVAAMNAIPGVLTSRYDIYQDVMDPANFKYLGRPHPDWTTAAWPTDLLRGPTGDWVRGWRVRCRDGKMRPCGVLCDSRALPYAERRVAAELKSHPYHCRFIDTTTASPWRECYDPNHPMTRTDSRKWKMKLLGLMSGRFGLVTGSETGHDAAVPYVHYFEGMLSLGPYRVPDAGRDMGRIWQEVPERVAKFQLGHRYRLPLWELVYHDCVVAQWYWGDYNNKLPALWHKRDLFNALYATGTMFMFNRQFWRAHRERFVASYRATCPVARATACAEMTDHRFLTPDRDVQQTVFANGVTVTVNFGTRPFTRAGATIPPMSSRVTGIPAGGER